MGQNSPMPESRERTEEGRAPEEKAVEKEMKKPAKGK